MPSQSYPYKISYLRLHGSLQADIQALRLLTDKSATETIEQVENQIVQLI